MVTRAAAVLKPAGKTLNPGTLLPQLPGGYVAIDGVYNFVPNYKGRAYRFRSLSCVPQHIDLYYDSSGKLDTAAAVTWAGSNTDIYMAGKYDQQTGDYFPAANGPLVSFANTENGFQVLTHGYADDGNLSLFQSHTGRRFGACRNNFSQFMVSRPMGHGLSMSWWQSAVTLGGNSNTAQLFAFGDASNFASHLAPVVNRLSVMAVKAAPDSTKLHVNDRIYTDLPQSGARATFFRVGSNGAGSTPTSVAMDYAASIVTQFAGTDAQVQAVKDVMTTAFSINKSRTNVLVATPHSLSFDCNLSVFCQTRWKQMMPLLTHNNVETYMVGTPGQLVSDMFSMHMSELTSIYDATVSRFAFAIGSAVNDVQAYAGGLAGDSTAINNMAQTIYDNYKAGWTTLKALGSNVRIAVVKGYNVPNFWTGTTQQKSDKAACFTAFNGLLDANTTADAFTILPDNTIDQTGALGDSVHTNKLGEGRVAAVEAGPLDALFV